MKVLIVHHCDSIGGAGLSARLCAKMLMDKHNVTVCIPHKGSSIWKLFEGISNISLIELGKNIGLINAYSGGPRFYGISFIKGILDIFNSKKEVKKILANDYDLIILNSIALSWALKIIPQKTKKIIYIRETKGNNPFYRLQNKYINRYADGVVFISNYDQKSYMLDTNKQCVIHNSCLPEFASVKISRDICQEMFGISNDYFNVLFVGGTETIKGYEIIIKAFKRLEGKPIRLIVAGKCELKKKIVVSNVCYLGEIINTSNLYNSVDLLVFPSVFPHQARPAFEAGFFKLPARARKSSA